MQASPDKGALNSGNAYRQTRCQILLQSAMWASERAQSLLGARGLFIPS